MRTALILLASFTGLVLMGLAQNSSQADEGMEIYRQYYCGLCHYNTVAGTKGIFGPPHDGIEVVAAARMLDPNYHGAAETIEAYLIESILKPEVYIAPGYQLARHRMPAYHHMASDELEAVIYFLLHQKEVSVSE